MPVLRGSRWPLAFVLLLFGRSTIAQSGCLPTAGCAAVEQCPSAPLYCANLTLADSVTDFSSTQGYRGWYYGSRTSTGNFTQYLNWTANIADVGFPCDVSMWQTGTFGQPCQCASGGHPVLIGIATLTVRRYIAASTMAVAVSGSFASIQFDGIPNCDPADGTTAYIRHNGNSIWSYDDSARTGILTPYALPVLLQAGDTLDFEISPNANSICDYSHFTAQITGLCASSSCSNIACNYSATPCPCSSSWSGSECNVPLGSTLVTTSSAMSVSLSSATASITAAATRSVTSTAASVTSTASVAITRGASTLTASLASSVTSSTPIAPSPSTTASLSQIVYIAGTVHVNGSWIASPNQVTIFSGITTGLAYLVVNGSVTLAGTAIVELPTPLPASQRLRLIMSTNIIGSFDEVQIKGPAGDCAHYDSTTLSLLTVYAVDVKSTPHACPAHTEHIYIIIGCVIGGVFALAVLITVVLCWGDGNNARKVTNVLGRRQLPTSAYVDLNAFG